MQAKSGTGKTCVFSTIALDAVLLESPATQVSPGPGLLLRAGPARLCRYAVGGGEALLCERESLFFLGKRHCHL